MSEAMLQRLDAYLHQRKEKLMPIEWAKTREGRTGFRRADPAPFSEGWYRLDELQNIIDELETIKLSTPCSHP